MSSCSESQREAALLLGQFAKGDTNCKIDIVQKGVVGPLIDMLQSPDAQVREMSTFAFGRLAHVFYEVCFMAEIVVFYDFVHFVGKMDFVAEPHPIYIYICSRS
ncbi:putative armadillo-like helical protein [Helianthus anomalus]